MALSSKYYKKQKLIKVSSSPSFSETIDWERAHQDRGVWHYAFSIIVLNKENKLLLQQRSKNKKLWPLFWSNTCCSHLKYEKNKKPDLIKQAEKRLKEEMGFSLKLKHLFSFSYKAKYKNVGIEKEHLAVLLGRYKKGKIKPDTKEVVAYKWVDLNQLKKEIKQNSSKFSPWFKKIIENKKFTEIMRKLCGK